MHSHTMFTVARVLLASVFVGLGLERVLDAAGVTAGQGSVSTVGLGFGLIELAAGLAILIGWQVRFLAPALAAVLLVDAVAAHPFWRFGGAERHGQLLHFLKNIAIMGGYLLLSYVDSLRRSEGMPR